MFLLTVKTGFSAEHQLKFIDGTSENSHCHDWKVKVAVQSRILDENGLTVDFNVIKAATERVFKDFEGKKLENLAYFKNTNASAENVARYIYQKLEQTLGKVVQLKYVEVTEEKGCKARYFE